MQSRPAIPTTRPRRLGRSLLIGLLVLLALLLVIVALAWPRQQMIASPSPANLNATPEVLARGAYLARAGDCMACHTARGGADYAGGRALVTPFGSVSAPNLTPDRETGIGAWSADDFWNALHNGVGRDGRLLTPAFPYPNYTRVTRADADALYTWLRSLPPVRQPNAPHQLRFPYNTQAALAAWRLAYFKPAVFAPSPAQSPQWNRGAYLVEGLGHCSACHASRNAAGASGDGLEGGLIPTINWYAPSLTADAEAGLGSWALPDIVDLLKTGVSQRATVFGPMAEVVSRSLQHLDDADVAAMGTYLKSLPATAPPRSAPPLARTAEAQQVIEQGKKLYEKHCIDCHGSDGKGAPPAYPPLAGNRALTTSSAVNPIRIVLNGGFAPGTKGNPRPYGMPAFGVVMNDAEVASVVSYLRASWGNNASSVQAPEVARYRTIE